MSRVVHVQTTVQTVFGWLDDDGNVTPQEPVVVNVNRFHPDSFIEAQQAIAAARDDAIANMNGDGDEKLQAPPPRKRSRA